MDDKLKHYIETRRGAGKTADEVTRELLATGWTKEQLAAEGITQEGTLIHEEKTKPKTSRFKMVLAAGLLVVVIGIALFVRTRISDVLPPITCTSSDRSYSVSYPASWKVSCIDTDVMAYDPAIAKPPSPFLGHINISRYPYNDLLGTHDEQAHAYAVATNGSSISKTSVGSLSGYDYDFISPTSDHSDDSYMVILEGQRNMISVQFSGVTSSDSLTQEEKTFLASIHEP